MSHACVRRLLLCCAVLLMTVNVSPLISAQSIQIAPSPVPTQTPEPTPSPEPTPRPQIVENSYQSRHGWSITWNDDWEASLIVNGEGPDTDWTDDSLVLRHTSIETQITIQTVGGPAGACEALVKDQDAALDADGEQLKSAPARTDTWIVTIGESGSSEEGIGTYQECHFLHGSLVTREFAYLSFVASAPSEDFQEASIAFLQVSEDIVLN